MISTVIESSLEVNSVIQRGQGMGERSICVHCGLQLRSISDSSSFVLFMPRPIADINFIAFVSSRVTSWIV